VIKPLFWHSNLTAVFVCMVLAVCMFLTLSVGTLRHNRCVSRAQGKPVWNAHTILFRSSIVVAKQFAFFVREMNVSYVFDIAFRLALAVYKLNRFMSHGVCDELVPVKSTAIQSRGTTLAKMKSLSAF